ncbi:unnamed protein product [Diplocarpon coronariae]
MSDRGRGRGRGGGGYQGDRGGGGGGRGGGGRGGGGGSRGGGGGRGGGGRGGYGGGGGSEVQVFKDPDNSATVPDAQVMAVEAQYMNNLKSRNVVARVAAKNDMPARPAFATLGKKITVYANYFKVNVPANLSLTRYNVEVSPEAKTKKLARIFRLLIELPEFAGVATEWKSMIISPRRLDIPADYTVQIPFVSEGQDAPLANTVTYTVRVITPLTFSVSDMCNFLASGDPGQTFEQKAEIIQVMNAVFGSHPQSQSGVSSIGQNRHFSVDRSKANEPNIKVLGGGLESLRGYFLSVRPATGGLLLNVNVTHGVFLEPLRLDMLFPRLGTGNRVTLRTKLRGVSVQQLHLPAKRNRKNQEIPRVKTIWGLAHPDDGRRQTHRPRIARYGAGPKDVQFWLADAPPPGAGAGSEPPAPRAAGPLAGPKLPVNQYISVLAYFQIKYPHIKLDPRHPVVNVGSHDRPSYLPAEACLVLPGQPIQRRLSPDQTQQMITFACRKPWQNASSIVGDGRAVLGLDALTKTTAGSFGLQVGSSLVTVAARVLPPPQIKYKSHQGHDTVVNPRNGSWNMADVKFQTHGNIGAWTYITIRSSRRGLQYDDRHIHQTVMNFQRFMSRAGINAAGFIASPAPPMLHLTDGQEVENERAIADLFRLLYTTKQPNPQFLLCILPYNDVAIYNSIKTVADTKAGVHTVCVVASKFMKEQRQDQYFGNVSLKFNLKAGGINHALDPSKLGIISSGQTMVIGLDVTHPSPGSKDTAPSVAGIVASVDKHLAQWPADFRIQEERKEMVTALEAMIISRLRVWQKRNSNGLPQNLLVYRDGVSEGQYQTVLDEEVPLIRNACRQIYPATDTKKQIPRISVVICGKRHHTRFYPNAVGNADRSSNCEPGTVVDRGVTEAGNWDFFLQAHACLQGTARSAHYYVIHDEIFRAQKQKPGQSAADALEELTHNMSHLFGRATKAVSLCPPAYYADLLCTRLRCYLADLFDPNDTSATPSIADGAPPPPPAPAPATRSILIPERIRDSMFYI